MAAKEKYRDARETLDDAELSRTSGTHRRITHEIDTAYGSARRVTTALHLERRPAEVPTLRAPTSIDDHVPAKPRPRETLGAWDFERPTAVPPIADDEPTSWLEAHLSLLFESRRDEADGEIEIEQAVLTAAEAAAVDDEDAASVEVEATELSAADIEVLEDDEERVSAPAISGVRPVELGLGDPELDAVRGAFERGDLVAVLVEGRALLARRPASKAVLHYTAAARALLVRQTLEELGGSTRTPRVRASTSLADVDIHPREAFILSLIDGASTVEEIVDMSGMPQLDVLRVLLGLCQRELVHVSVGR